MSYAKRTKVPYEQTQTELIRLLQSKGANKVATMQEEDAFHIAFTFNNAAFRMTLPAPNYDSPVITKTESGADRPQSDRDKVYRQEVNRVWRSFLMVVKAKFVAIDDGITTVEKEFFGNVLLKGGDTIAERYGNDLKALNAQTDLKALGCDR